VHRLREPVGGTSATYEAWCDMDIDDGGWTLAIKVDGTDIRFAFDSPDWTSTTVHNNDKSTLDAQQAKLRSFSSVPLEELLVGFAPVDRAVPDDFGFVQVPVAASSLAALFSGPNNVVVEGAAAAPFLAVDQAFTIEPGCRRVFVNFTGSDPDASLRFGLVGSATADCAQGTTWIGVGGADSGLNATVAGADTIGAGEEDRIVALLVRSRDLTGVGSFASCAAVAAAGFKKSADYTVGGARTRCVLP
jgi:hypothetical protein